MSHDTSKEGPTCSDRRVEASSGSNFHPPSPSNCNRWEWYFLSDEEEGEQEKTLSSAAPCRPHQLTERGLGVQADSLLSEICCSDHQEIFNLSDINSTKVFRSHQPKGGSVGDGKQGNPSILCGLKDVSLHIDANGAGTLIQEGVPRAGGETIQHKEREKSTAEVDEHQGL